MHPLVFLIGLHGCGKTSVGRSLESDHGYKHLSLGDLGRLARKQKRAAEYSLRLMCMLSGQSPGDPLREELVDALLKDVERLRLTRPVSVDGFPAQSSHLALLPKDCAVVHLDVPQEVREARLQARSIMGPRKWTPGRPSLRDAELSEVLRAGGQRIQTVDATADLATVVRGVWACTYPGN